MGRFQVVHGRELVEDFFFTDTQTSVSLSLSFSVLKLNGNVQASLMEVGSCLIVIEVYIHGCHAFISFEALTFLLVSPELLSLLQVLAYHHKHLCCLVKSLL